MDEWIPVGVFAPSAGGRAQTSVKRSTCAATASAPAADDHCDGAEETVRRRYLVLIYLKRFDNVEEVEIEG